MKSIKIQKANIHNLKNVSLEIPLDKLVVVVGKSGSGKSSLVYDVLFQESKGNKTGVIISKIPKTYAIEQKVTQSKNSKLSLGEYNLKRLNNLIEKLERGDLLIADEPCVGFTAKESTQIAKKLKSLVVKGIGVIVVEHCKEMMLVAEHIIEFGPKSGSNGGKVIFEGDLVAYKKSPSKTARYVFTNAASKIKYNRQPNDKAISMKKKSVVFKNINKHNFKDYSVKFPLGSLVTVTGKSGSGKTTLLKIVYSKLFKGKAAWKEREFSEGIKLEGKENIRRSYLVDQTPIGNHPTSRPVTYLGIWDNIRDIYAGLAEAKKSKLTKADFIVTKEMLDTKTGFPAKVLKIKYKNKSIAGLLKITVNQALEIFKDDSLVTRKLGFLQEVGLGYLTLGQPSNTLSGGEAQRIKLAKILSKKLGDRCIYILDIPSRGLHLSDLPVLVKIFQKIIDKNNTILIAENREEIKRNSDFVIELS